MTEITKEPIKGTFDDKKNLSSKSNWFKQHPILTIILILFAIGFFSNSSNKNSKKSLLSPTLIKQEKTRVTISPPSEELTNLLEYSVAAGFITKTAGEAFTARSDQLKKYPKWNKTDSYLFYVSGNMIETAHESLTKLTPPKLLESVHQKLLKGLGLWKQSVTISNKGFVNSDASLLKEAADLINEGTVYVEEANKEIKEITEEMKKSTNK